MVEAAAHWRQTYAVQRFRFTLKHNPSYFLTAFTDPRKFSKELLDLIKYHIQVNGFTKWLRRSSRMVWKLERTAIGFQTAAAVAIRR